MVQHEPEVRPDYLKTLAHIRPGQVENSGQDIVGVAYPGNTDVYSSATSPRSPISRHHTFDREEPRQAHSNLPSLPRQLLNEAPGENDPGASEPRRCSIPPIKSLFDIADRMKSPQHDGGYYSGESHYGSTMPPSYNWRRPPSPSWRRQPSPNSRRPPSLDWRRQPSPDWRQSSPSRRGPPSLSRRGPPSPNWRRQSSSSGYSWQGSISSASEMSPRMSTARVSPTFTPASPAFPVNHWHTSAPVPPPSMPRLDPCMAGEFYEYQEWAEQRMLKRAEQERLEQVERERERLERLERAGMMRLDHPGHRRYSVRQAPYEGSLRSRRNSVRGYIHGQVRDTGSISSASSNSNSSSSNNNNNNNNAEDVVSMERKPHFNQPYTRSVKLFILYFKNDCKWGWPAINARRLELLPLLLGESYKREVEENRKVAGINGFYYRLNAMMPALTPDGSGLLFMKRGERYWEYTESSKCRASSSASAAAVGGGGGAASSSSSSSLIYPPPSSTIPEGVFPESSAPSRPPTVPTRSEVRPRGMVDRYPEEVVHFWEKYVKHFVPAEKHAEVYDKAVRYSAIRAEQRRENGVPQWTPDNEVDRVFHTNPPDGKSKAARGGFTDDQARFRDAMSGTHTDPPDGNGRTSRGGFGENETQFRDAMSGPAFDPTR